MTRLIHLSGDLTLGPDTSHPTPYTARAYYDNEASELRSPVTLSANGHAFDVPAAAFQAWFPGWEAICDAAHDEADFEGTGTDG